MRPKELCGIFTQTYKEKKTFPPPLPALILHKKNICWGSKNFFFSFHQSRGPEFFNRTHLFLPVYFWVASHCSIKANHLPKMLSAISLSPNKSSLVVDPKNQLHAECASKCKTSSVEIPHLTFYNFACMYFNLTTRNGFFAKLRRNCQIE